MKDILEKYFNGETSLEEEKKLRAFFRTEEVPEELKPFALLFQTFDNEEGMKVSPNFEGRLFAELEEDTKVLRMRTWPTYLMRIAAVGAVLLAAFFALRPMQAPGGSHEIAWEKYEITDEEIALEETKKALLLLSSKLNRGKSKTIEEVSKTEKVTKYFN